MAQVLGYKLTGSIHACDACGIVKSKAHKIPRSTLTKTTVVGERVGLDISGPFPLTSGKHHRSIKQKMYWYGLIDHFSSKTMNSFRYNKSELVDFVGEAFEFMKTRGTPIKIIRIDNAGENAIVAQACRNKFNITVELTPPDTPKLNGKMECSFAIR